MMGSMVNVPKCRAGVRDVPEDLWVRWLIKFPDANANVNALANSRGVVFENIVRAPFPVRIRRSYRCIEKLKNEIGPDHFA